MKQRNGYGEEEEREIGEFGMENLKNQVEKMETF
jgi:hypothetical protein